MAADKAADVFRVGIDLGTARSAIVAEEGERAWVESYVGWPLDFVARKVLGKAVLFGEEARLSHRSARVVQPLEHGVIQEGPRGEEAAALLLQHLFELIQPPDAQAICAVVGVPSETLCHHRQALYEAARACADAVHLVPEPFAVAYGQGALTDALVIDIGAGTVDVCVMRGTLPEKDDLRSHAEAGDAIDQRLLERMVEMHPKAHLSLSFARQCKEQHGFVGAPAGPVRIRLPVAGAAEPSDLTQALRRTCESIVAPVVEMAEELIHRQEPHRQAEIRQNIYLAGGGSLLPGLAEKLQAALDDGEGCRVQRVPDPLFAGAEGALALAQDLPEAAWNHDGDFLLAE